MFLRYNLYTIIWACLILVLVLLPGQYMPKLNSGSLVSVDKLAHVFIFCVLVLLMIVGFAKQSAYPILRNKAVGYALKISVAYALVLEVTQGLSTGRMVELYDGIANVVGCFLGYGLFYVLYKL